MPKIVKQTNGKQQVKSKSVIDRISPIGFDSDGIKINLYGRSGTGKTTLWATFPKPILCLVCSGGGELRSVDTPANRKTIKQVVLQNSLEIEEITDHVEGSSKYATVILDHASGLQDMVLKELLNLNEIPEQLSWGLATQQQYGQLALQVKTHLRRLLNLSCNVVIVAQEREFNVDTTSELLMPYVASALSPSITGWLNPACDYICQTFIRETITEKEIKIGGKTTKQKVKTGGVEYCLRTAPDPIFTTKFRVPKGTKLPSYIVDPSFTKIENLIKGGN